MPTQPKAKRPNQARLDPAVTWEPIPPEDREYVIQRIGDITNVPLLKITEFVDYWNATEHAQTQNLAKVVGISRVTASRWRKALTQALYFRREQAARTRAIYTSTAEATGASLDSIAQSDMTPDEMVAICDSRIRALLQSGGKDSDIQKWMDFKVKFQGVSGAPPVTVVDPHRLLGAEGLSAIQDEFLRRIEILAKHHHLYPRLFQRLHEILENLPEPTVTERVQFEDGVGYVKSHE